MNPSITDLDLDVELTTDCLDVAPKSINLRAFDTAVLKARHPVLANFEGLREFNLREPERFSELSKLVGAHLVKHAAFVLVDGGAIDGTLREQVVQCLCHQLSSFSFFR